MKLSDKIKIEVEQNKDRINPLFNGTITFTIKKGRYDYMGLYEAIRAGENPPDLEENLVDN